MVYDIRIELKMTQEKIVDGFLQILKIEQSEILFYDDEDLLDKDSTTFFLQLFIKPKGFQTSLGIFTEYFQTQSEFYNFLKELSNFLSSRIFIDETDKTGTLFIPNQEPREASFDIGIENDDDYLYIIE